MLRLLFVPIFTFLLAGVAFAQKHLQEFQIAFPKTKISNSLYNRIQLLDVRNDTTNLGVVHEGYLNREETLIANPSLRKQLHIILSELVDSATAQSDWYKIKVDYRNGKPVLLQKYEF